MLGWGEMMIRNLPRLYRIVPLGECLHFIVLDKVTSNPILEFSHGEKVIACEPQHPLFLVRLVALLTLVLV